MALIATNECECPVCRRRAFGGATHPKCRARYSLDGLTSFFYYNTVVREVIKSVKYRFVSDMVEEFVSLVPGSLYGLLPMSSSEPSIIVPIPLHSARVRYRGFNQAEKISTAIGKKLHIPVRMDILARSRYTEPQVSMRDPQKRRENMRKVFALQAGAKEQMNGVGIFLVDDVFTTGATMRSAAEVLKRGDAKFVWAVTMAR